MQDLKKVTYSTDDLFTLLDGTGSEHHTAEPCWRRGFWGVSVKRANRLLASLQSSSNHITPVMTCVLHHCLWGGDLNMKGDECKPPTASVVSALFTRHLMQTVISFVFISTLTLTPRRRQRLCNLAGWIVRHTRSPDSDAQTAPGENMQKTVTGQSYNILFTEWNHFP